jgi:anti-sigma regulatory factor (Ser/Thr protein kinase)
MHTQPWYSPLEQEDRWEGWEGFTVVDLRLPAQASELKRARDCVASAAAEFGFGPRDRYQLIFAVNEAVTNAIKHGTPDDDGTIGMHIYADGDSLVCSVRDCGPFVVPRPAVDLTSDEGGRGFAFMSALTDELELSVESNATVIRLRKRRPAGALVPSA